MRYSSPPVHENRRRSSYSKDDNAHLFPVIMVASLAAIVVHILFYYSMPYLLKWDTFPQHDSRMVQDTEEVMRIIANEKTMKVEEVDVILDDLEAAPEMRMDTLDAEIDLLDLDIELLIMAPGETNLSLNEAVAQEDDGALEKILKFQPHNIVLPPPPSAVVEDQYMDFSPVNANNVIANIAASQQAVDEVSRAVEGEMVADAKAGLPSDTRSLADLMKVKSLGASSGVARLGVDLLFEFGKSKLRNTARVTMLQLAALIYKNPDTHFIIEGHTDGIGARELNNILSLQRAAAVRAWLESNRIPSKNVYLRACGSSRPLSDLRASREKQGLNRRVEIHMRSHKEKLPLGCIPSSYKVDLKKSAAQQFREGILAPPSS